MGALDREGTCANCGHPIIRREREQRMLDGTTNMTVAYTCGVCLQPRLADEEI